MKKIFTSVAFLTVVSLSASAQEEVTPTLESLQASVDYLEQTVQQLSKFQESFNDEVLVPIQAAFQEALGEEHDYAKVAIDWITENGNALVDLPEAVQSNMDGIEVLSTDVKDLVMANRENQTDIAALKAAVDDVKENVVSLSKFQETFDEEYMTMIQEAIEAVDVTNEVQGLQEVMRGKANVEDVTELEEAVKDVKANVVELSKFQQTFDEEYMTMIQEAIEAVDVTNEVQGLQESMRGKANVEDIVALQEAMDIVEDDVRGLVESNMANRAGINGLIQAVTAIKNILKAMGEDVNSVEIPEIIEVGDGEDDPVAVEGVEAQKAAKAVYSLNGTKVEKAGKGVYIVDGEKVLNK